MNPTTSQTEIKERTEAFRAERVYRQDHKDRMRTWEHLARQWMGPNYTITRRTENFSEIIGHK